MQDMYCEALNHQGESNQNIIDCLCTAHTKTLQPLHQCSGSVQRAFRVVWNVCGIDGLLQRSLYERPPHSAIHPESDRGQVYEHRGNVYVRRVLIRSYIFQPGPTICQVERHRDTLWPGMTPWGPTTNNKGIRGHGLCSGFLGILTLTA